MMVTVLIKSPNINPLNSADLKANPHSKVEYIVIHELQITVRVHNILQIFKQIGRTLGLFIKS